MSAVPVIEDDDRIRLSLCSPRRTRGLALEDEGYEAGGAPTAEEGIAAQRRRPADTVLVDLMLPGIDGFECIRALRRCAEPAVVVRQLAYVELADRSFGSRTRYRAP